MPSPTADPAARLREAARVLRISLPATSLTLTQRTALAELDLAVAAVLQERGDLLDRISVAKAASQATVDAGDEVQRTLTLARAHLELAIDASVAGRARAHEHAAVSALHHLGVGRPDAEVLARATVAVTPRVAVVELDEVTCDVEVSP